MRRMKRMICGQRIGRFVGAGVGGWEPMRAWDAEAFTKAHVHSRVVKGQSLEVYHYFWLVHE